MHLLLFEVTPFPERRNEYLDIAARLKAELERTGGCRHIERFRHLRHAEKLLSFQIWEDEASLVAWRNNSAHQEVQVYGREMVFENYRLRVAEAIPDWQNAIGTSSARLTDAAAGDRLVVVLQSDLPYLASPQLSPAAREALDVQSFASLYRADQYVHLIQARPDQLETLRDLGQGDPRHSHAAVVTRDYGLFDRSEAPQQRPPVARGLAGDA